MEMFKILWSKFIKKIKIGEYSLIKKCGSYKSINGK